MTASDGRRPRHRRRPQRRAGSPRGTCAIAPVRGDVTTMRAAAAVRAAAVRARRRDCAPADAPARGGPGADAFPAHLLRVGPA